MKKNRKIKSWKCFLFAYFYLFLSLSREHQKYIKINGKHQQRMELNLVVKKMHMKTKNKLYCVYMRHSHFTVNIVNKDVIKVVRIMCSLATYTYTLNQHHDFLFKSASKCSEITKRN